MYVVNTQRMELGRGYLYVVNTKVSEEARLPSITSLYIQTQQRKRSHCASMLYRKIIYNILTRLEVIEQSCGHAS